MSRRCSHCGHDGHNSRTCLDKGAAAATAAAPGAGHGHGFKLFGVCVTAASDSAAPTSSSSLAASPSSTSSNNLSAMRKSFSMGNLSNYGNSDGASPPSASLHHEHPDLGDGVDGYASDDVVHTNSSSVRERKKGVPWTEEEHRSFLLGLKKLGKGDWRGISRNFVKTRTPTQVASHAQKYFLRRNNLNKRRRRSSLFDITSDTVSSLLEESVMEEPDFEQAEAEAYRELNLGKTIPNGSGPNIQASLLSTHNYPGVLPVPIPSLKLSIAATNIAQEGEYTSTVKETKKASTGLTVMETVPEGNDDSGNGLKMFSFPVPFVPFWPPSSESKILKPTPIMPACLSKTGGAKQTPELSLSNSRPVMEPSPLSYKLQEEGSRQSAFHSMSSSSRTDIDNQGRLGSAISVP